MNLRFLLFVALLCSACFVTSAQKEKKPNALQLFLQANADSTIIFQRSSNWIHVPSPYYTLSKKTDTITAYTYKSLPKLDKRIKLPRSIAVKIRERDYLAVNWLPIDVNMYFQPVYFSPKKLLNFWKNIGKENAWLLADDSVDGHACIDNQGNRTGNYIYDGGGIYLYLITKNEIKKLDYYAPQFFEKEVCPGRKGRISILKIEQLFDRHFSQ
ncbi:hypothetical protein [Pedobacter panaciterrae]|uniref:hypothetical protein n=1 Tax=Pedobacter panaciterrae TaxID=363849 RepID=UPI002591EC22|nr:hypothetical protein [uncultured Pedobacter sp.]